MSTKNHKGLLVSLGVVAIVVGVWYFRSHTKRAYATTIVKFGGSSSFAGLLMFDEGYLKNWAKAITKGATAFNYQGKDYHTSGGMLV